MPWLENKVPPPLVAAIWVGVMWGISKSLPSLVVSLPASGYIAFGLMVVGVLFDVIALFGFGRSRTTLNPINPGAATTLVTGGVFRWTRNPMYLGLLLLLCAWAFKLTHPIAALCVPFFVLYMNRFQIAPEERALSSLFGTEYETYKSSVRRWI